ncbi:Do family serine endopeptidase [Helicobacter cetorum]|uniref:Protease DO n=1 Tax=Helicobacter cetorum (strain ATCC BAA-429 / MIT 00-7128) TaxID=182217 RepID=I0EM45_HELC0|nr:Do family serine endopeptidase [Helicobacter cetorum]AFI04014.1 protease DO [Helicobacter cetorum MIT 00-7128]
MMKKTLFISLVLALNLNANNIEIQDMPKIKERVSIPSKDDTIYSYHDSIKDSIKAVVNISTEKKIKNSFMGGGMFSDPFFQQFFGDLGGAVPKDRIERALGSGVIISKDGYIVTNNHVINEADKITVTIPGSTKEYSASLVGTDADSDLAVIRINKDNLPTIKFSDSNDTLVGDLVFAIGNPFGVGETVTQGIVSALNKSGINLNNYENYIQTDASINPGNSGGALIDSRGGLIGINTAIISKTGGNHGIGFAIPSNMVKNIVSQLIKTGKIERGYLGVGLQDANNDLQSSYDGKEGAVVISVEKDSPAKKAGLLVWDLITEVNGKKVKNSNELKNLIGSMLPNQKVTLKVIRDKKERFFTLILAERKNPNKKETTSTQGSTQGQVSGLKIEDLTPKTRKSMRLPDEIQGVIISQVQENSPAEQAGFRQGNIITRIEDVEIKNVGNFNHALDKYKGKPKRFLIFDLNQGYRTIVVK